MEIKYSTLDHWRGIAALAVVYFHAFGSVRNISEEIHPMVKPWKILSDYGCLGVPIFFVISGYCVTASAYVAQKRHGNVRRFLLDRMLRIFPTYWCACLLAIAVNVLASPLNGVPLQDNIPMGFFEILGNLLLLQPYFRADPILEVSWSLVFEVAFYIVIALGLLLFRKGWGALALATAGCILAVLPVVGPFRGILYFTNLWSQFLLGSSIFLCCWLRESGRKCAIWPVLIVAALSVLPGITQPAFDILGTSVAVLFALLLFVLRPIDSVLASLRAGRFLVWLGNISFSLYLTHCFLGLRIINICARWITYESPWQLPVRLFAVVFSVLLGFIFFKVCEQPLENLRRRGLLNARFSEPRIPN